MASRNGLATTTLGTPYVILGGDINGTTTITITSAQIGAINGIVDGDLLAFTARIVNSSGGMTIGTQSVNRLTVNKTAPTITLFGQSGVGLYVGDIYTDYATSTDSVGGLLTTTSSGLFSGGVPIVASTTGTSTIMYSAHDASGNVATMTRTITVYPISESQTHLSSSVTVSSTTPSLIVGSTNTATSTIDVPLDVTNSEINLFALKSGLSATTPGAMTATLATSLGTVLIAIPSGTTLTASSGLWDGTIKLPSVVANSSVTPVAVSGSTASVSAAIEVGAGDIALTFDKAVRILVPGMAGKLAGYSRGGIFTQITTACSVDTQAAGDALGSGGACVTTSGSDMVIWTKHFTTFVAYTQTANPISASVNNIGNGAPVGLVGAGGYSLVGSTIVPTGLSGNASATVQSSKGQVLGAATYVFSRDLSVNSAGTDVAKLQELLTQTGVYAGPITGSFGPLTKIAVQKYQKAHNITQTGTVGPKTRESLTYGLVIPPVSDGPGLKVALPTMVPITKLLAVGVIDAEVVTLQTKLTEAGYFNNGPITGYFGDITRAAVIKYQKANGISPVGFVGPATRELLNK